MLFIVYILQPMTNNIFYKFANAFFGTPKMENNARLLI